MEIVPAFHGGRGFAQEELSCTMAYLWVGANKECGVPWINPGGMFGNNGLKGCKLCEIFVPTNDAVQNGV